MTSSTSLTEDVLPSSGEISRSRRWFQVACVTALTFGLRVLFYVVYGSRWSFEEAMYWDGWGRIALFMSQGYGLADTHLLTYFPVSEMALPTASRPPLPILMFAPVLRLFGENLFPIVLLQIMIDTATAFLIYLLTYRLLRTGVFTFPKASDRAFHYTGLLASLGFAFFTPEWSRTSGFYSEPLFTLLLTLGVGVILLYRSPRAFLLSGLLFGLAALARPSILLFPLVLLLWLIWGERVLLKHALLLPLCMAFVLLPWGVRNYVVFQRVIVTQTLGGYDLFRHSGQIEHDDYIRWVPTGEGEERVLNFLRERRLTPQTISEPELDALLSREALRIIWEHPWRYLNLSFHRATWLFYDHHLDRRGRGSHLAAIYFGFVFLPFGLVALGWWRYRGAWIRRLTPVWLMVGYTIVIHAMIAAQFRFILPLVPLLSCVSGYVVARIISDYWQRRQNRALRPS
ncbi:MAG: hypothetical protein HY708_02660 [Ignavibacteriae bacterium]|nr:hypothetical protein [Ignavibacteriota bacterium]